MTSPGITFGAAGMGRDAANRRDLATRKLGDDAMDRVDEPAGGQHRVVTLAHGRGARVVRAASDGHVPAFDADDAFDDPDVDGALVQDRSLLDMKLEVRRNVARPAPGLVEPPRIATDECDALAERLFGVGRLVELVVGELTRHRAASGLAVLLVLEDDDFEWMPRRDPGVLERLRDFDRRHRADLTIIVPAMRYGVRVGPEHERRQIRIDSPAPPENVAGMIDRHIEPRLPHESHGVSPSFEIGVAIGHAVDPALRRPSKPREFRKGAVQSLAIDTKPRTLTKPKRPETKKELTTMHDHRSLTKLTTFHHAGTTSPERGRWLMAKPKKGAERSFFLRPARAPLSTLLVAALAALYY